MQYVDCEFAVGILLYLIMDLLLLWEIVWFSHHFFCDPALATTEEVQ